MNLDSLPVIEPKRAKSEIPSKRGIYFWFDNKSNQLVYIGIAVGIGGLKKRIISQHLNPKYLEYRAEKHTLKDKFQLENAIERLSKKDSSMRKGIDKSAFRKSIGRTLNLKPGIDTVNYIVENLYLKINESEDIDVIKVLEKKLIGKYQPKFNTTYKNA